MNKQSGSVQSELAQRVSEVLFYVWDPIGVNRMPACRDEYEDYVPIITAYLLHNFPESGVEALLLFIMEETIGVRLTKPPRRKAQQLEALRMLLEWRADLFAGAADTKVLTPVFPKDESFGDQLQWSRQIADSTKVVGFNP